MKWSCIFELHFSLSLRDSGILPVVSLLSNCTPFESLVPLQAQPVIYMDKQI